MANERLTLEIAAKAIGQESIDQLSEALNRFSDASEKAGKGGGVTRGLNSIAPAADNAHGSMRRLFLAVKDLGEGRSAFATVEAGYFIQSLGGIATAAGFTVAALGAVAYGVYKIHKEVSEGGPKMAHAFDGLNSSIATANDELRVTGDRLRDEIAKLQNKPQNTLALALDEARVAADKLAESISKDIDALNELFKKEGVGRLNAFITGRTSTASDEKELTEFARRMASVDRAGLASVRGAKDEPSRAAAQAQWNTAALAELDAETKKFSTLVDESKKLDELHRGVNQAPSYQEFVKNPGKYAPFGAQSNTPDETARLAERQGTLQNLNEIRDRYALTTGNDEASAAANKLKAAHELQESQLTAAHKRTEELKKADEQEFANLEASHKLTIQEEIDFYEKRKAIESADKDRQVQLSVTLGHLYQERAKQQAEIDIGRIRNSRSIGTAQFEQASRMDEAAGSASASLAIAQGKYSTGDDKGAIDAAYLSKVAGANAAREEADRNIEALRQESAARESVEHDVKALDRENADIRIAQIKAEGEQERALYEFMEERERELAELQKKRFDEEASRLRNAREIVNASTKADVEDRKAALSRESKLVAAQTEPGNEPFALGRQLDLRRQAAELDRQEKQRDINAQRREQAQLLKDNPAERVQIETTLAQLRVKEIEDQRNYERELGDERIDIEIQIAEIRKKQAEDFKNEIGSIFDAITSGQPNALANLLKQQVLGIGRTITENVAKEFIFPELKKIVPHASDPNSAIGKILQGTPFGADPLKSSMDLLKQSVDRNSAVWEQRTQAQSPTGGGGGLPSSTGIAAATGGFGYNPNDLMMDGNPGDWGGPRGPLQGDYAFGNDYGASEPSGLAGSLPDGLPIDSTGTKHGVPQFGGSKLGKDIGLGAAAAGGAFAAFNDFKSGGVKNDIAGVGAGLGSAAAIAAMIPGGQVVALGLGIASAATSLISSFLPDPHVVRENAINKAIAQNTYVAPQALNVTQDSGGNFADFDAHGNLRSSNFSAVPTVRQGSIWEQTHGVFGGPPTFYQVPGGQTGQFGAPTTPPQPHVTVNLNAIDAPSFASFAQRNAHIFGNAAATALQNGHGALAVEVQRTARA